MLCATAGLIKMFLRTISKKGKNISEFVDILVTLDFRHFDSLNPKKDG